MQKGGSYGRLCSFLAWSLWTCWTLLLAPAAIFSRVFDRGATGWKMARSLRSTAWSRLFGQRLALQGAESVSEQRPAVYAAKHVSFLDVPALFRPCPSTRIFSARRVCAGIRPVERF